MDAEIRDAGRETAFTEFLKLVLGGEVKTEDDMRRHRERGELLAFEDRERARNTSEVLAAARYMAEGMGFAPVRSTHGYLALNVVRELAYRHALVRIARASKLDEARTDAVTALLRGLDAAAVSEALGLEVRRA